MIGSCVFRASAGTSAVAASLAAALFLSSSAVAQEVPGTDAASAESASEDGQTIIVTGSRIARSTFDTPSPVTVLGAEQLEETQVTNIGEAVADIPAFRPSNNPSTNGFGSFNVGAQIVNLRGLGVTRNLVLVDGRRFAPTTREGSVDLNFVPSTLVSRVEVVTGGASAAYGSDALAGVVNVILDTKLDGFKAQLDYGIAEEGDGKNLHAGIGWGGDIGDAGHLVIGGEYSDQKGVGNCFTRDWCKIGAVVTNNGFATGNGNPNFVRSDDNAGWFVSPAGVVSRFNNASGVGSAIANSRGTGAITFGPNGGIVAAQAGTLASGLTQLGGDIYATYTDVDLIAPVERYTAFGHLDWDLSDNLRLFVEGSYGHVDGATYQAAYFSSTIPIYADNPYIPAGIRSIAGFPAPAQPTAPASLTRPTSATFNLAKIFDDLARGYSRSKADTYRFTTGLNGDFGDGYSWDFYYQYGRTDRLQTVSNNLVVGAAGVPVTSPNSFARFFWALDAVVNPANGQITCRALLSPDAALRAAAAGCAPVNLFGAGNVSEQGKDYIYGQLREDIKLEQHVGAATLRGDAGEILGAPLSFATGAEFRVDKINVVHDDLSNIYAYFQNFGSDYSGKTEVFEAFAELEMPIANILTLNGALRQAFYKTSGFGSYLRAARSNSFDGTTWKISANLEPTDWIRLRATQSRDIRAPNFAELFLASASSFTPITNPFVLTPAGARTTDFPSIRNGGSPELKPEKADTTTIGIILQPHGALEGLQASVDAYRINVRDFIGSPPGGAQGLVNGCFNGIGIACDLVTRDGTGKIIDVRNTNLNLERILAKGIDFEIGYRIPMGENALQLRGLATYVDTLSVTSFGETIDRAGQTGSSAGLAAPRWTATGTATFSTQRFAATLQGRYIAPGKLDAQRIGPDDDGYAPTLLNSITDNHVDGRFYANLFASIWLDSDKRYEIFGSVSNLFNKAPPSAPETQFFTNPVYFDTLGRYFRFGARVKM